MAHPRLKGLFVPVTTPFDPVTGDVAPVSFRENLRRWAAAGIDGFVLFGSNGEGAMLDEAEKAEAVGWARAVAGERPIVAGAGAESTRHVVREARAFADAGADAVIVHPPAYYGEGLAADALRVHYLAIAEASPIPVVVYNIPKYTHVMLEAGLVSELARHENVAGVKESSGDLRRLGEFADGCGDDCAVFVGNGTLLYAALEMGAAGAIIALGLLAPEECARILQWHSDGRAAEAGALQERIAPVHTAIVGKLGVPGVKAALDMLGMAGGPPRPPLAPLRERERGQVAAVLRQAGLLE